MTAGWNRIGELARSRAFHGLTEEDCQVWFGVGPGTLERIEAGEVEPSPELEQRIHRFLNAFGAGNVSLPAPTPGSSLAHGDGLSTGGGGAVAPTSAANFGGAAQ